MDYMLAGNNCFADIDDETAKLIIQLQLDDIEYSSSKGKDRPDDVSDISVAFKMQKEELENIALFLSDQRMTRSIALAVQTDGAVLTEAVSRDDALLRDHSMALQLYRGPSKSATTSQVTPPVAPNTQILNEEVLQKLQILYVSGDNSKNNNAAELDGTDCSSVIGLNAESSTWAASRSLPSKSTCVICRDEISFCDAARVPGSCRHEYCRTCLEQLFHLSMSDESLFPPRCCNEPITIASVRLFLTSYIVHAFEEKRIEFETPNRTYCCLQSCSAFIHPSRIVNNEVLDLARDSGWQRCYSCWDMVKLEVGCNHIKCRCGATFCYICGLKWKTCRCPQWHEDQLIARATEIVNRRPGHQLLERPYQAIGQGSTIEAQIAVAAEDLRQNHACEHNTWRKLQGSHQREGCHHTLGHFIFACRQCELRVCNRCRLNRL
ncbi:putative ibr finger domain protein [Botrytis fragariae]|uniref:Putative ibr finger domain protein n=1 Tax=Botrytis fragariae TaxID=1964551 RepID=A0A8H6EEL4_9HELO|nr:putative ibr finger domain protein [Botrytis fragariae]KAF5869055.1 putative ibr finger domain protein [Botrytis fragariae]